MANTENDIPHDMQHDSSTVHGLARDVVAIYKAIERAYAQALNPGAVGVEDVMRALQELGDIHWVQRELLEVFIMVYLASQEQE